MDASRWSDDHFLDSLRVQGDALADSCVQQLTDGSDFRRLFEVMNANSAMPADMPAPLLVFFHATHELPSIDGAPIDRDRLSRGEKVYCTHAFPAALILLAASVPQGYAAPNLTRILMISRDLDRHPYRRLLGVLQMVINVSQAGGFEPAGSAVVTAQKMRLLHAGIRRIARKRLPDYEATNGVPVNVEDMLATVMGFSLLVIDGLHHLDIGLSETDADDYYYLWRVFAQLVGLHPSGDPHSGAYVPANLTEARRFYQAYARRHFVQADANPDGVHLARTHLQMMCDLLPRTTFGRLGMEHVPRIYMQILNGPEAMRRIGIAPVRGFRLATWMLRYLPRLWSLLWSDADRVLDPSAHVHENLSRLFFERLIDRRYGRPVTFLLPEDIEDMRKLA